MKTNNGDKGLHVSRRGFLQTVGVTAAGVSLASNAAAKAGPPLPETGRKKRPAVVRCAFLYPPTATLDEAGYYSWPGKSFDAEGRQRQYAGLLAEMAARLEMSVVLEDTALDTEEQASRFIAAVKAAPPDGLLLIPFKKSHWNHVTRIVKETGLPTVILATLGVLLVDHIAPMHRQPGVYLISSLDNMDAVEEGMRMVSTACWMKQARLVNIAGAIRTESTVPHLGTQVLTVPHQQFYEVYAKTEVNDAVRDLARAYERHAKEIVEPKKSDILDAARAYHALKQVVVDEEADALMMDCLPGLQHPHKHVPPCMGFMSLRGEGIPAGCQADLNPTLTMMLVQRLFGKPGFQQNASMETERNHYFGAHCTSPSRMHGLGTKSEPYILRSHAEAGWGCVPRVLFTPGQAVTLSQYLSGEKPQMLVYSGEIVCCPPMPPAGGCRTNIEMTINEVQDVCDVKGMHQIIFYGNHARALRAFCQLYGIEAVV
jgi:hypothetical protein